MTEFVKENLLAMGVLALCGLEILTKGMVSHTYRRLLRAVDDMGHSEHPMIKSLCRKFEMCYQLRIGVPNVDIFVEKYLCHYRVLGLRFKSWEGFGNLCMLLAMLGSLGGGVAAMVLQLDWQVMLWSICAGVAGVGAILLFDCLFGINAKREMLRVDMIDYLENVFKPRLENETFHAPMMEQYQREYFDEEADRSDKVVNFVPKSGEAGAIEFTEEEEAVIRDVIREYMG